MTYPSMTYSSASLTYRRAATQQASTVGLVIALYDTLVGDLRRAVEAMECKDISGRCQQLTHAFTVLHHLELMIDYQNGGKTALSLQRFYKHLRQQMLDAQFKLSPAILQTQIRIILEVRESWQKLDAAAVERSKVEPRPIATANSFPAIPAARISFSC